MTVKLMAARKRVEHNQSREGGERERERVGVRIKEGHRGKKRDGPLQLCHELLSKL